MQCALVAAIGCFPSLQSAQAAKRDASKMITILALGDSLTAGYGLSRKEAYPALIAEKMRSANYQFEVINAGSSGDTTAGGLRRLPPLLRGKKIDVLILALGINDAFRGVPVEQMRSNLQAIIDQTRARHPGVSIIIAGMQLPAFFERRLRAGVRRNVWRAGGKESRGAHPVFAGRSRRRSRAEPAGSGSSQCGRPTRSGGKCLARAGADLDRRNPFRRIVFRPFKRLPFR